MIRRDKPSVVVVRGREQLGRLLSATPLYFAYRGPHEEWFKAVAEKYVDAVNWASLPAERSAAASRRDLITGGFIKLRDTVVLNPEKCIWCGLCVRHCPASAFDYSRPGRSISVKYDRCIDCGLCNSLCPVEAIQMPSLPDQYLAELIKTAPDSLRFICDYAFEDSDVEGIRVKCIAALPKQYLYLAAAKHGEARAYCSRQEKCPLWPAAQRWAAGLARDGLDYVVKSIKIRVEPGDRWQSRILASAAGMPVGTLEVAQGCTLCGACVSSCPTNALAMAQDELRLMPALCIACGICAERCPEGVIKVSAAPSPAPLRHVALYRDQPARCKHCGRELPYSNTMASKIAQRLKEAGLPYEHVHLCEECRIKRDI